MCVERMGRATALARELGARGVVVPSGMLLQYFTGMTIDSHERLSCLVLGGERPVLLTPAVDTPQVDAALGVEQRSWADGSSPYAIVADVLGGGAGPVVVGQDLTANHVLRLQALVGAEMLLAEEALAPLLQIKDPAEVAALADAGAAIDRVHAAVPALLQPGRTEAEVAAQLRELILAEHARVDFIIVGSGENGARPHHDYSDRVLAPGDMVVVDIGGTMPSGYCSDCTRTYVVPGGATHPRLAEAYEVLRAAQQAALDAVRPGVPVARVDAAARDLITAAGFGAEFFHRTGHGIGLSTHEEPSIAGDNEQLLAPGMVFSVEPGIYLDGLGGARIEDIVVVTDTGVRRLNSRPRTLDGRAEAPASNPTAAD
nr:Xaa-Pro peptidase family protein [Corynebacterium sp. 13CS0277]